MNTTFITERNHVMTAVPLFPEQPSHHHLTVSIEQIGPAEAAALLAAMPGQRSLRKPRVKAYARLMKHGLWKLNGDTIGIDEDGNTINGQHRLHAVIESGCTIEFIVVRGIPASAISTIDTNLPRNHPDSRVIRGLRTPSVNAESAIARWWWIYENGNLANNNDPVAHQELDAMIDEHPSILSSATYVCGTRELRRLVPQSVIGFLHAYTSEYAEQMATDFVDRLASGSGLEEDNPIAALRRLLIGNLGEKRKMHRLAHLEYVIMAWNLYYLGKKTRVLRRRGRGPTAQAFPRIVRPEIS